MQPKSESLNKLISYQGINFDVYYEELLDGESNLATSETIKKYHKHINKEVKRALEFAYNARSKGLDPKEEVEIYIAQDVASRTEGLVGPKGIAKRFKEMEEDQLSKDEIVVQIAKEIAQGQFGSDIPENLADQALRTALSYQTEGITAAPIEGIGKVEIKSNKDGSQFLAVYYSGPIRSAGGTAQGVSVYIADIIRKELKLARYKATDKEVERMLEEVRLYNKIMHLQLPTSDEEIRHAWRNIPIMIHGDPTESEEVGGYRNIESMGSNRVRGGACLVLNDGLVGRAKKIMKRIDYLQLEGWDWLKEISKGKYSDKREGESVDGGKPTEVKPDLSFASDALMGRPTFADATSHGGWRLRYGHARNTGIAGIGIHPALMAVVNDFLAPGTHIRTERPGKGSIVAPIDTIRPPIVKLTNGDVLEITSYEMGVRLRDDINEILFLGDMLVGYGEFLQNNYRLVPPGYCEEWWGQEMLAAGWSHPPPPHKEITFYADLSYHPPDAEKAIQLAEEYKVALHPKYTPAWKYLTLEELQSLHQALWNNDLLPSSIKPLLEKIFVPHTVDHDGIDLGEFLICLRKQLPKEMKFEQGLSVLELINKYSDISVKDSMGTTIGARMGRPEKAKARRMSPQLHGLFPLGDGVRRILGNAIEQGTIEVRLGDRYCTSCNIAQWEHFCHECGEKTKLRGQCTNQLCNKTLNPDEEGPCNDCGSRVDHTRYHKLDMLELKDLAGARLGQLEENSVKLKDRIDNPTGTAELLEKGILRARYDLHVFRDGTIRYDATDAPLTHFYPYETAIGVERLVELGYTHDIYGQPLTTDDQLLEIKPQDIIVNDSAIKHFLDVANFVDRELTQIYELPAFYNIKTKEDLVGQLVIGLAPHTSAGVIGRIIGFTRSSVCWAHPFWHSSKRRNCDGDEDGIILLMDGFLNFSKEYLPTSRGSKMDTPLVLVATLNPAEVDDESFNLDSVTHYPLAFYYSASDFDLPGDVPEKINRAEDRIGSELQYEGFTFSHLTKNIAEGPLLTRYKDDALDIRDKLAEQLNLAEIIRAVDERDTALRIFEKHALPDLMGNLRAFSTQQVRCVTCNTKYRRVPLRGNCVNENCRKSNLIFTVPPGGVTKYFDVCEDLVHRFRLGKYHEDRLVKIKISLDSLFAETGPTQTDLSDWM